MHGSALAFMVSFWALVLGLVVFVFCRLYCPNVDLNQACIAPKKEDTEKEEVT